VLIEQAVIVLEGLRCLVADLEPGPEGRIDVVGADAAAWLEDRPPGGCSAAFDICFLDPPYEAGLLAPTLARLAGRGWMAPGGRVYLEAPRRQALPPLPAGWDLLRDKCAGQVRYALLGVGTAPTDGKPPCPPDPW
jgi:16S rRNA (guanine966-N2)-methyltransferase